MTVYVVSETDPYLEQDEDPVVGVFSSLNKALSFALEQYGVAVCDDRDKTSLVLRPNRHTLVFITEVELDGSK